VSRHAPQFCAIVVTYFTGPALDPCLDALLAQPDCAQIVIINNGNPQTTLATLKALEQAEDRIDLIDGQGNIGFGAACNLGAIHARTPYLVFVNPDCIVDPDCLPAFGRALRSHPNSLIGGALRNEDGSEQRGCRRGELTPWSAVLSFTGLGQAGENAGLWRDFNRNREPFPDSLVDMPVVSGALFAISKEIFDRVGGFDRDFFLHVEDIDLCRRVRGIGALVQFLPQASALHIGATSQVSSSMVKLAKIKSFAIYFWKHARTPLDYALAIGVMPLIAPAIYLRALRKAK
jgi:N-acetylglucosaminyl-diphospho-decaprenol L-rhamnosyltransferase